MFYSPMTSIFVANYSVHPWKIIHRVVVRKIYFGCCIVVLFQFFIGDEEAGWMYDCIGPEWINACPRKREREAKEAFLVLLKSLMSRWINIVM